MAGSPPYCGQLATRGPASLVHFGHSTWGAEAAVPLGVRAVEGLVAVSGTVQTTLQPAPGDPQRLIAIPAYDPIELRGGVRVRTPSGLQFGASAGGPLQRGIGTPRFRVMAWIGVDFDLRRRPVGLDPDKDGLSTDEDLCPFEAETRDSVRDTDGCPEADAARYEHPAVQAEGAAATERSDPIFAGEVLPLRAGMALLSELQQRGDLDGDLVLDPDDRCVGVPEDADGFMDEDGCPDLGHDEDGDGVGDWDDLCPREPEHPDGVRDTDGCPEADAGAIARYVKKESPRRGGAPALRGSEPPAGVIEASPGQLSMAVLGDGDADRDGVKDRLDVCAELREDADGYQDEDGCPEEDNDGDGIRDPQDRCPDQAEIRNGILDDDGCPDRGFDSDEDGVDDFADLCPWEGEDPDGVRDLDGCPEEGWEGRPGTIGEAWAEAALPEAAARGHDQPPPAVDAPPTVLQAVLPPLRAMADSDEDGLAAWEDDRPDAAEDGDGFLDDDGCPEADNDEDGVPEDRDLCPQDGESANAYEDDDGCPDEIPAPVLSVSGVVRGLGFAPGSDRLLGSSLRLLREVRQVLTSDRALLITIIGHTDMMGDHDGNVRLSRARAQAVATWLASQGVDASRMVVVGEGPDRPIDTNLTPSGRASNRRVELSYEHIQEKP